jgi:hypothetical protein
MLHSPDVTTRQEASSEVFRISSTPGRRSAAIRALIRILEEPGVPYRTWYDVAQMLGSLEAPEAADVLARRIDYSEGLAEFPGGRGVTIWALAHIGEPAVSDLRVALVSGGSAARAMAASALGLIGGDRAEQALRQALPLEKEARVTSSIAAALRLVEQGQSELRETTDPAAVARNCLASGLDGFKATPVKTLFLDGRPRPVDEYLCHVDAVGRKDPTEPGDWWLLTTTSSGVRSSRIGKNRFSGYAIGEFLASPDGKYLAVLSYAEGAPSIQVVDLVAFVRRKALEPIRSLPVGLGTVSLKGWSDGALQVASDTLFIGQPSRMELLVHEEEVFSWDIRSGGVVPVSEALRDPVRYYCGFLGASDPGTRSAAAVGLRLLDDKSAVPCVEAALQKDPDDTDLKATRRHLLAQASPAAPCGRHLAVSGTGSDRQLALFSDRARFLERASIAIPEDITPDSIERGLQNVVWDRDRQSAAVAFERAQGSFVAAFVANKTLAVTANDISGAEIGNLAAIGPTRVYVTRTTRPVEWRTSSTGGQALVVRTEAWDSSGRRYAHHTSLAFDENSRPKWR